MPVSHRRLCLVVFAGACTATLPEAELAHLLDTPPAPTERLHIEVEIDSDGLAGTFDAVLIARPSPPAVRLQLLPPMGAPILDVAATPESIAGLMYGESVPRVWRGRGDDPPLAPLLFFGITLLEQHAALTLARVREGRAGSPPRLRLRGCFADVAIEDAEVVQGRVVARTFAYRRARWSDRLTADGGIVEAPGFRLCARVRERETADDVDDALFALAAAQRPLP